MIHKEAPYSDEILCAWGLLALYLSQPPTPPPFLLQFLSYSFPQGLFQSGVTDHQAKGPLPGLADSGRNRFDLFPTVPW